MKEYWHGNFEANRKEEANTSAESVKTSYSFHLTTEFIFLGCNAKRTLIMKEPDAASWEIYQPTSCNFLCRPCTLDKWKYNERIFELVYYPFPGEHRLLVEETDSSTSLPYQAFGRRKIQRTVTFSFLCFLAFIIFVLLQAQVKYKGVTGGVVLGLATVFASVSLFSGLLALGMLFPKKWISGDIRDLQFETSKTEGDRNGHITTVSSTTEKMRTSPNSIRTDTELQHENIGHEHNSTQKIVVAEINSKSKSSHKAHTNFGLESDVTGSSHASGATTSHAVELGQSRITGKRGNIRGGVRLPPVEQKGRESLIQLEKLQQQQ